MLLVYLSLTGNVRNFVERVGMKSLELNYTNPLLDVNEDYVVIVPTYEDDITETISLFIEHNNNINHLKGFVGSGSLNFDNKYCFNAEDLSKKYNVPLIFKFEFSGNDQDIIKFREEVKAIWNHQN